MVAAKAPSVYMSTDRWWVLAIFAVLILAGGLRLRSAADLEDLEWVEVHEFVPAALTLSWDHLPLRVSQHGAVPIYLIRASTLLFGRSMFEMRLLSVLAGTATVALIYFIAARWWGRPVGVVAAALLAVERYHVEISGRAFDLPFDLLFVALAMFAFSRFLSGFERSTGEGPRAAWLYVASASCALGFLCKELTAIMLPVLAVTLLLVGAGRWFLRRETWYAVGVFVLVVAPDIYAGLTVTAAERAALWERHKRSMIAFTDGLNRPDIQADVRDEIAEAEYNGIFMSHADQLSRFRSVGFNREPFYFYFGGILDSLGVPHENEFEEFPYVHPMIGILLWLGVLAAVIRRPTDKLTVFCLTMFVVAFIPFALVQLGKPRATMATDPVVLWYWVDRTMLPAVLLAAHLIVTLKSRQPAVSTRV